MRRRDFPIRLRTVISLTLVVLICQGCEKQPTQQRQAVSVRLNVPFPAVDFAPFYVAKQKGWLDESLASVGAKSDILAPFQSIPTTYEALAANRVDMVMSSEVPPMISRANGTDVKIAWLSCTLDSEIIVPPDSRIKSVSDLRGTKVGTLSGSDSHYWLIRNLERIGINRSEVQFVNLSPPDGKAALNTKAVDVWATFPPFSTFEVVDGRARAVSGADAPIQVVLVTRGAFWTEHRKEAEAVIVALDRAKDWLVANPSEAQTLVAKETNLALKVVEAAWPRLRWESKLDAMTATIQSDADYLANEGLIRRKLDVRSELVITK